MREKSDNQGGQAVLRDVRSIVVFACNLLGDSICRLPAIKATKEAYASSRLAVVADPRCGEVFEGQPFIDEVWHLSRRGSRAWRAVEWWGLARRMRRARPDLVLDLYGSKRTAFVSWLSGAKWRAGLHRGGRSGWYNLLGKGPRPGAHIIEQMNEAVRPAGVEARFAYVPIVVGAKERKAAESVLSGFGGGRLVLLNPSARVKAKRWAVERFGEVARRVFEDRSVRCGVITAPGEEALTEAVVRAAGGGAVALPVMSLKELAAVLERTAVLVTGDTGVLHLGAAMGCPAVILAGPTDPRLVLCESCRQVALFHRGACEGWETGEQCAGYNDCRKRRCIDAIGVEEVMEAVRVILR